MKIHSKARILRCTLLAAGLLLASENGHAAGLLLNFDNLNTSGPLADPANIFITFSTSQPGFDVTYSDISTGLQTPLLQLANLSVSNYNPGGFTPSISLAQASNFTINFINSGSIFVSYGQGLDMGNSTNGPGQIAAPSPTNTTDHNFFTRYSPFEITFAEPTLPNPQGDVSAINYFSGALGITNYDTPGNHTVANGQVSYNAGVTNNQIFSTLAPVAAGDYIAYVTGTTPYSGNQTVPIRVTAANSWNIATNPSNGAQIPNAGYGIGPYHDWSAAIDRMATANFTTNLSGNQSLNVGNDNWTWHYNFDVAGNSTAGVYLNGTITSEYYALSGPDQNIVMTGNTIAGLVLYLPPDGNNTYGLPNYELSYLIYSSDPTVPNNGGTNATIGTQANAAWGTIDSLTAAGGNHTMLYRVLGDFSEGILVGLLGSPGYGNLTSNDWWTDKNGAYTGNTTFLTEFGNIIWNSSNGTIYSNQYDDRFGQVGLPATGEWVVTIFPDGASVPEPAVDALVAATSALVGAAYFRRRARATVAKKDRDSDDPAGG